MLNLTTNITVANAVTKVARIEVLACFDNDQNVDGSPIARQSFEILVQTYGTGVSQPKYSLHRLVAFDVGPCEGLAVNPSPQTSSDQLLVAPVSPGGTPYTSLSEIWNGATNPATKAGRKKAIEGAIKPGGVVPLLSAEFSGT